MMTQAAPPGLQMHMDSLEKLAAQTRKLQQLADLELKLETRLKAMVPRDEYAQLAASLEAVRAARSVFGKSMPDA